MFQELFYFSRAWAIQDNVLITAQI
ncbi:hypothetical protein DSM3645_27513 [Blastopirellula marina DSM 3645]|uniref:Uncharacterized protein n=1 Tax=Blastopirellula marina DSM 3645 TaxID=314230 RepID=A3ZX24_9BACT|nr:hypothetical protein DSM3645_27513 [Blastopirellula marina DSM 3645]